MSRKKWAVAIGTGLLDLGLLGFAAPNLMSRADSLSVSLGAVLVFGALGATVAAVNYLFDLKLVSE